MRWLAARIEREALLDPAPREPRHELACIASNSGCGAFHSKNSLDECCCADHLNSSTVVMDSTGATLVNLSFAAFGARRGSA